MHPRSLAFALAFALLLPAAARAGSIADFQRTWRDAGDSPEKKVLALEELGQSPSEESLRVLVAIALKGEEPAGIVTSCIQQIARFAGTPADDALFERLDGSAKWAERAVIVRALALRTDERAVDGLIRALADKEWQVQAAAVHGLSGSRSKKAIEELIKLYQDLRPGKPESVRLAGDIDDALFRLTGLRQGDAKGWAAWWEVKGESFDPSEPRTLEVQESVTKSRTPVLFEEVSSRRVVFIVDTSASMRVPTGADVNEARPGGRTRFEVMVTELKRIVADLPKDARFNIVSFGDAVMPWAPRLVSASPSTKRKAERFIDGLKPDGATNSHGALEAAFQDPTIDTIIFLSDGYPTAGKTMDTNKILGEVRGWNVVRGVRVHTIAFVAGDGTHLGIVEGDKSLPKDFMKRLAQENDGRYRIVE